MFFKRAKKSDGPAAAVAGPAAVEVKVDAPLTVPLDVGKLRRDTLASRLGFKTTSDLKGPAEPFEAKRVQEVLRAALAPDRPQSHVCVVTPPHAGAVGAVAGYLATLPSAIDAAAPDWVIVTIDGTSTPVPVAAGRGRRFADGVTAVIARLRTILPYMRGGEDLKLRLAAIESGFDAVRDDAFARLRNMAEAQNVAVLTTSMGFTVAPMHEGKVVKPEVLNRLPEAMRSDVRRKVETVEGELQALLSEVPAEAGSRSAERIELISDYIRPAVVDAFSGLAKEFDSDQPAGVLLAIQNDLVRLACRDAGLLATAPSYIGAVLAGDPSAKPVITIANGELSLAAALLRAGKGVAVIDASALDDGGWTLLKTALRQRKIPHPDAPDLSVPCEARVVLVAQPRDADRFGQDDAAFAELFHTRAAFAADAARSEETEGALARSIAAAITQRGLLPFDSAAIARLIGEAARVTGRPDRLSGDLTALLEISGDASRIATLAGRATAGEADVEAAAAERQPRASVHPLFAAAATPVPGRVLALGLASEPVEVWAIVRPGQGRAADITRAGSSAESSSSASAMLWSYLAALYVPAAPLALSAAIVHEPPIAAGNRTATAELYAVLSALADAPIKSNYAAVGWVSPSGTLLPVADINAAIEDAYDHAAPRDAMHALNIVMPRGNETGLMLRGDVVEAVRKGRLNIYTAGTIDEGLTLLTGLPAGRRDDSGNFEDGSFHRRVDDRLLRFARSPGAEPAPVSTPHRPSAKAAGQ